MVLKGIYNMDFVDELNRLGIEQIPGMGIFCMDFGVYFPYVNQDILQIDISLSTYAKESGSILNLTNLGVLNHRYPNKVYLTLSQKFGKKLCKCGCIIQHSHEELAGFKYLNISYGLEGYPNAIRQMSIPINIITSDDKSCVAMEIHYIFTKNIEEPDLKIRINERQPDRGWKSFKYNTGQKDARFIHLTPENTKDDMKHPGYIVYQETVKLIAHKPEDILV